MITLTWPEFFGIKAVVGGTLHIPDAPGSEAMHSGRIIAAKGFDNIIMLEVAGFAPCHPARPAENPRPLGVCFFGVFDSAITAASIHGSEKVLLHKSGSRTVEYALIVLAKPTRQ